ncbi:MAG TPA: hypothetical protein VLC97_17245 [Rhodanobacteraceae bacterium]|nr:hypothetical protein [Rhodanobacteraceae bacterium]
MAFICAPPLGILSPSPIAGCALSIGGSRCNAAGATGATAVAVPANAQQITNKNAARLAFNVNAPVQFDEQLMIASSGSGGW